MSGSGSYGDRDTRRRERNLQLEQMSDAAFAAEVRAHQQAQWRRPSLEQHAHKHRLDYLEFFGHVIEPEELDELSRATLLSFERLFTGLEPNRDVIYIFVSRLSTGDDILIVVSREGRIRTVIPMETVELWWQRHPEIVEVTTRAKGLGF